MKLHLLWILLGCCGHLFGQNGSKEELLNNNDIITLSRNGLSSAIVKAKIQTARTNFNLSADSLLGLKKAGVGDDIILAMMAKTAVPGGRKEDKPVGLAPGWYYKTGEELSPLEPVLLVAKRARGLWGGVKRVCNAFVPLNIQAETAGTSATVHIHEAKPICYFVPDCLPAPTDSKSPGDFFLVRMQEKGGNREVIFRKPVPPAGVAVKQDASILVSEETRIAFTYKRVAAGFYEIRCREPLTPGQYCFMVTRSSFYVGASWPIFDFTYPGN